MFKFLFFNALWSKMLYKGLVIFSRDFFLLLHLLRIQISVVSFRLIAITTNVYAKIRKNGMAWLGLWILASVMHTSQLLF